MKSAVIAGVLLSFVCVPIVSAAEGPQAVDLPKVLVIGDSISLGYTPYVAKLLKGLAVVTHSKGNAQHTGTGLEKLDEWIGEEKWGVIHFNWGLWDLCYRNPKAETQGNRDKVSGTITTTPEQYEENLNLLVSRLKKTGAKLIWASTTVVPENEVGRVRGDDIRYNDIAAKVMKEHGVAVDDLHALTSAFSPDLFVSAGNVHYTPIGYQRIAKQVADCLRPALAREPSVGGDVKRAPQP